MIFLSNADGTITATVAQPLYQGSSQANEVVLIGPFPASSIISVAFRLPNGQILKPRLTENVDGEFNMTELPDFAGKFFDANGTECRAWRLELDATITAIPGVVTLQFFVAKGVTPDNKPIILPTSSTTINIGAGVTYIPVNLSEADWDDITTATAMAQKAAADAETAADNAEQAKQEFLDLNPLFKLDVPRIVYATDERGEQKYFYYSTGAAQSTFPIRRLNGQITAPDQSKYPPSENEYVSRAFGDGRYVKKNSRSGEGRASIYGATNLDIQVMFPIDANPNPAQVETTVIATKKTVADAINELKSSITGVYQYKGSVTNYDDLPTENLTTGDVYNVVNTSEVNGIDYPAGTNFAWNGTEWDALGGDLEVILNKIAELEKQYGEELKPNISAYTQYTGEGVKSQYTIPKLEYGVYNIICGAGCDITFKYKSGNTEKTYSLTTDALGTKSHVTIYKFQFNIQDYGAAIRTVQGIAIYYVSSLSSMSGAGCHTKFNIVSDIEIIPNVSNGVPAIPLIIRQQMNSTPLG